MVVENSQAEVPGGSINHSHSTYQRELAHVVFLDKAEYKPDETKQVQTKRNEEVVLHQRL